ncbi:MAG: hypothetical protein KKH68_12125 [Proteobacteria bacterium]|nr:hypothetical protein [Pseudomonadota bacterium]
MLRYGLKTKISVNLAILLVLAMLLIDFVVITTAQQVLVESEISKGYLFISTIESILSKDADPEKNILDFDFRNNLKKRMDETGFACGLIMDANQEQFFLGEKNCVSQSTLAVMTRQSLLSQEKFMRFTGTTWAVFWQQSRYLVLSAPLRRQGRTVAGATVVLPLEKIYKSLRRTQYILLIYIFINTVVLTLAGLLRLSRLTIKPLQRLVKRADEYSEDVENLFLYEKEDHDFNKLSRALNSMLQHIAADKEKLRMTVTSLGKANLDLKQAQDDIIRAEKLASVGRLSSGIAHEIGNPLGIVIGYLELLKQNDISDEDRKEFIARTENELHRINAIIRQLLDFSRPSKDPIQAVFVHEILHEIVDAFRYQPVMASIDLQLDLKAAIDIVMADSDQLRQVFLNLLINAADAISLVDQDRNGKITITSKIVPNRQADVENAVEMLRIEFIDNGPGIPEEHMDNIFDPFYTTKEPGKGTGLGLSVCFIIVEGIGGKIKAASSLGQGSAMILDLPLSVAVAKNGTLGNSNEK